MHVCKETSHISYVRVSQNVKGLNVNTSTYYLHVKTKILADFEIYISVPLRTRKNSKFYALGDNQQKHLFSSCLGTFKS